MSERKDHWNAHARAWQHLGPPLRPSTQDVAFFADAIRDAADRAGGRPIRVLLLGVTPELATLPLPTGSTLTAADRSDGMLAGVWPGNCDGRRAIRAAWNALPLPDRYADVVLGDGCYTVLSCRHDRDLVNAEIRRVLKPEGRFAVRQFLRPSQTEAPDAIFDDLLTGRIESFHAFKWRLAAALHGTVEQGLRVDDVWQAWATRKIDSERLAAERGWPPGVIATIGNYRGSEAIYFLPTLGEIREEYHDQFCEVACRTGDYELAPLFPTLSLAQLNLPEVTAPGTAPSWSAPRIAGSAARRRGPGATSADR